MLKWLKRLLVMNDPEQKLNSLRRTQRLMLKRAYGKTHSKPLYLLNVARDLKGNEKALGSKMEEVARGMVEAGYCEYSKLVPSAVVLTNGGMELAQILKQRGWPGVEKE